MAVSAVPLVAPQADSLAGLPQSAAIMIFGASGDLTARKLLPALYHLWLDGFLADDCPIIGVARRDKTDESFREEMRGATFKSLRDFDEERWTRFASRLFYQRLDLTSQDDYSALKLRLESLEEQHPTGGKRIVYLAVAPELFEPSIENLASAGMIDPGHETTDRGLRVVVEKPFGHDLPTARQLSDSLGQLLREDQIYRIDHYLGKETVQNILLFRFGNAIFEPLLNRSHVDHVQITVAETVGMERGRGGYYDKAGAMRDVLQNHVLQLLCLVGMEPPAFFRAGDIRDEKLKVLEALRPADPVSISNWAVPGQYVSGVVAGERVPGYRDEERIPEGSNRDTYVAIACYLDNWRWAGVPFYLRTGKRMADRVTEIAVQFKHPPMALFDTIECDGDLCKMVEQQPNRLIFRIQPKESIVMEVCTKRPGMQYQLHPVGLDFAYQQFELNLPEAYERLLLDVMRGDSTLFTRNDELEAAWRFVDPILDFWEGHNIEPAWYSAGSWGPKEADQLLARTGREWRRP